jgi:hypothetical protein
VQFNTDVPPPGRKATITRATNRVFVENESAYVLPGGKSILQATQRIRSANNGFSRKQFSRQYPHGNQVRHFCALHSTLFVLGITSPQSKNFIYQGVSI